MDEIIKKAKAGNRSAVTALYNKTKDNIYAVSFLLLENAEKAKKTVTNVYSNIWNGFDGSSIQTEKEFLDACIDKAVSECKKIIIKADSKSFQPPKNQNFTVVSENTPADYQEALSNFSTLQRFIFITRVVCKMSPEQIAKTAYVDISSVKLAMACEKPNFERMGFSLETAESQILEKYKALRFHTENASSILNAIENFVTPFEKKALVSKIKIMSIVLTVCIFIAVLTAVIILVGNNDTSGTSSKDAESTETSEVEIEWSTSVTATDYAVIDIKDYGKISVALDSKTAPITVANFKKLANEGFYDGLTFHRIIENFMMQGGDPDGDGIGGSDEEIKGEFYANGVSNNLSHVRGAISMARTDAMDSASSQFFIVHKDSTYLNGNYAVFGYVVDGIEIVDKICADAEPTDNNGTIPASEQPIINSVKIYSVEEFESITENSSEDGTNSEVELNSSWDASLSDESVFYEENEDETSISAE